MSKIYSRPRIKIPRIIIQNGKKINSNKGRKILKIIIILVIAFSVVKFSLDAVSPIFDTICENRAESLATVISNEQATAVMKEHTYDEMFTIDKDSNNNITMIKSNIIAINEIISDIGIKIQEKLNEKEKDGISIAIRKFYRFQAFSRQGSGSKNSDLSNRQC